MRPQSRFTARAARSIALCLAVLSRGCGGSTPPPAEVDLGRAPGDPEPPTAEQPNAAARAERAKSRRSPVSQEPADPTEEPGYLTLVCDPACDDVSYEGRSYIGDRACRDRAAALLKAQPQAPSSSSP